MATILFEFEVWEHYPDQAPEPFGSVYLDHVPNPEELITLHWSDGRRAYQVIVNSVEMDRLRIHARHVPKLLTQV